MGAIEHKVSARAGLIGNPSDGYGGKTIAVPVRNFYATVRLWEIPDKIVIPHDASEFESSDDLLERTSTMGFYDAGRLVKAATAVFLEYLKSVNKYTNDKKFEIDFSTTIPRMVGLAGSSAIITGTMKCLQDFYGVKIKPEISANLVWAAEKEKLWISGGLQDRVVQAFDDLVYMDFSEKAFKRNKKKYGNYKVLDKRILPNLYLLYQENPSESGMVHSNFQSRYTSDDANIRNPIRKAMRQFAKLTDEFKEALLKQKFKKCAELQNRNFDIRRELCRDQNLGKENIEMIEIPRELGCSSKFSGSGGAVIGIYINEAYFQELKEKIKDKPYKIERVIF